MSLSFRIYQQRLQVSVIKFSPGSNHRTRAFFHDFLGSLPAGINQGMKVLFHLLFVLPISALPTLAFPYQAVPADRYLCPVLYCIIVQYLQIFWPDPVIAVDVCNILPFCQAGSCISGPGQPTIFLVHGADSGVLPGIPVADLPAVIRGAVIYQDQLKVLKCLAQYGFNACIQILLHPVNRDNYTYHIFRSSTLELPMHIVSSADSIYKICG